MTIKLTIHCDEPWLSLIAKGVKPVEGRKGKQKYRDLKPGDKICFYCDRSEKSFVATVQKVDCFASLNDYLHSVSIEKALPGIASFEEGLHIYYQWSSVEEIAELGFVGIWIEPDLEDKQPCVAHQGLECASSGDNCKK